MGSGPSNTARRMSKPLEAVGPQEAGHWAIPPRPRGARGASLRGGGRGGGQREVNQRSLLDNLTNCGDAAAASAACPARSEEHTSELQSQSNLVCRLLLEKKNKHHALTPR